MHVHTHTQAHTCTHTHTYTLKFTNNYFSVAATVTPQGAGAAWSHHTAPLWKVFLPEWLDKKAWELLLQSHEIQLAQYLFLSLTKVTRWLSQVVLVVKNLTVNARDIREAGSIPGSGRFPWRRHGNPLQYCCVENPMDEKPGGLQPKGSQRGRHDWSD